MQCIIILHSFLAVTLRDDSTLSAFEENSPWVISESDDPFRAEDDDDSDQTGDKRDNHACNENSSEESDGMDDKSDEAKNGFERTSITEAVEKIGKLNLNKGLMNLLLR